MSRPLLVVLHLLIGVSAAGAGLALARRPGGEALGLKVEWLEGSPFRNYCIPGLFLAFVIGSSNLVSAATLLLRTPWSATASFGSGLLLLAWVSIQTLIIGFVHWTQIVWWFVFSLVTFLAGRELFIHRDLSPNGEPAAATIDKESGLD